MTETFKSFYRIGRNEFNLTAHAAFTFAFCAVRLRKMTFTELRKWLTITGGYLRTAKPHQLAGLRAIVADIEPNVSLDDVLLPNWSAPNAN